MSTGQSDCLLWQVLGVRSEERMFVVWLQVLLPAVYVAWLTLLCIPHVVVLFHSGTDRTKSLWLHLGRQSICLVGY